MVAASTVVVGGNKTAGPSSLKGPQEVWASELHLEGHYELIRQNGVGRGVCTKTRRQEKA